MRARRTPNKYVVWSVQSICPERPFTTSSECKSLSTTCHVTSGEKILHGDDTLYCHRKHVGEMCCVVLITTSNVRCFLESCFFIQGRKSKNEGRIFARYRALEEADRQYLESSKQAKTCITVNFVLTQLPNALGKLESSPNPGKHRSFPW